jgi:hypothetical protein
MTLRAAFRSTILFLLATAPLQAADKATYAIKVQDKSAPPKEVAEPIRKLLAERSVQLLDGKGEVLVEVWMRQALPAKATEAQIKNGLTWREVGESTVLGAVRVAKQTTDYRKQKIPPGVYTLRLAYQPQDGDHMGTAPYSEFGLLCPTADDKRPDALEAKALHELSAKTTSNHPAVWLIFPGEKGVDEPKLLDKGDGHQVLMFKQPIAVGETKTAIGMGLALIGHAASA